MDATYGWQRILTHDGRFIVELSLYASTPAAKVRALQSGARPNWKHRPTGRVLEGPVILSGDRQSIRPGETGTVEIHPFLPQDWADIIEGAELELLSPREAGIGTARVVRVVDMPPSATVDLSWTERPSPSPSTGLTS
jgi:hypothetical protein